MCPGGLVVRSLELGERGSWFGSSRFFFLFLQNHQVCVLYFSIFFCLSKFIAIFIIKSFFCFFVLQLLCAFAFNFKKLAGIVSRRVTHWTSIKNFRARADIDREANDFVNNVRADFQANVIPRFCLANADQSGFLKEQHSSRSLA